MIKSDFISDFFLFSCRLVSLAFSLSSPLFHYFSDHFSYLFVHSHAVIFTTSIFHVHAIIQTEQNSSGAYLPIAVKSASEEIVYLQLDSRLSLELLDEVDYCILLYCTISHWIVLCYILLFCTILHCSVLCSTIRYSALLYSYNRIVISFIPFLIIF
jgi:hypothetical protein